MRSLDRSYREHGRSVGLEADREMDMNMQLNLKQNLVDFDEYYDMLTESHAGLDRSHSEQLNAQLALLLANHIGDLGVIREAFALARVAVEIRNPGVG